MPLVCLTCGELTLSTEMRWLQIAVSGGASIAIAGRMSGHGRDMYGAAIVTAALDPAIAGQEHLEDTGLYLSEKFGPFAYIQSDDSGGGWFVARLVLPPEVELLRLGLRLFNCDTPLLLTDFTVTIAEGPQPVEGRTSVTEPFGQIQAMPVRPSREPVPNRDSSENLYVNHTGPPELMISIDVEAFPRRASQAPLDRLIWGRHPDGESGVLAMMRIAEKHNVKLTMYLDFAEADLYGPALLEIGREIDGRGHDLELHCHAEFIPERVWVSAKVRRAGLSVADDRQCGIIADYVCEHYMRACRRPPLSYRGGAYRFNAPMIHALTARGISIFSNYNASRPDVQPLRKGIMRQFYWSNGSLELPISHVPANALNPRASPNPVPFNFNMSNLDSPERLKSFLETFHRSQLGDIAVLVMHSWSFGKLPNGQSEHYDFFLPEFVKRFDDFLGLIRNEIRVVTARDVAQHLKDGIPLSTFTEELGDLLPYPNHAMHS